MFGQESGPPGGGVDIVKASFDIEKKTGDPESWALECPDLVCQGEAGIRGTKPWEYTTLVRVEHGSALGDGGKPHRLDPFEDF